MAAHVQNDDDIISGINITPLVDITLVILIIFIVTASFVLRHNIPVELPKASTGQESTAGLLNLAIDRQGTLFVNGQAASLDELPKAIEAARAKDPKVSAFIAADVQAQYGAFARVVDRLRLEGVTDIALDTQPKGPEEARR